MACLKLFSVSIFLCLFSKPGDLIAQFTKQILDRGEGRGGSPECASLQADTVQCYAQRCTIYGPWTVYKKQCSLSERQANWGQGGSFPCRKLCFGIIYAVIKMFPLWRKTAGSTNGHLLFQPNMKKSLWAATLFSSSCESCVKCWDCGDCGAFCHFIPHFGFQNEFWWHLSLDVKDTYLKKHDIKYIYHAVVVWGRLSNANLDIKTQQKPILLLLFNTAASISATCLLLVLYCPPKKTKNHFRPKTTYDYIQINN